MEPTEGEGIGVVMVLDYMKTFAVQCNKCKNVVGRGRYTIGIQTGIHCYLVGNNPPKVCCNEEKKVPLLFTEQARAEQVAQELGYTLKRDGDTSKLHLIEVSTFTEISLH